MDPSSCPTCNGEGTVLGTLGQRTHYRCRQCGMEFSKKYSPQEEEEMETEVKSITRDEFYKIANNPEIVGAIPGFQEEKEWLKTDSRLGIIIFELTDKDWNAIALAVSPHGSYHAYTVKASLPSAEAARKVLMAAFVEPLSPDFWK